eukprot:551586-Pyramimonas_sp.AAC.1
MVLFQTARRTEPPGRARDGLVQSPIVATTWNAALAGDLTRESGASPPAGRARQRQISRPRLGP